VCESAKSPLLISRSFSSYLFVVSFNSSQFSNSGAGSGSMDLISFWRGRDIVQEFVSATVLRSSGKMVRPRGRGVECHSL
jgi:hypothetical protein